MPDRFQPPTVAQRGQVANAMAAVYAQKPEHGEATGQVKCTRCGGALRFNVQSSGISRGQCSCGLKWHQ